MRTTMTRKEFLRAAASGVAAVTLVSFASSACGGDDDGVTADAAPAADGGAPDAAPSCTGNGAGASGAQIFGNHGHVLVVPAEDVNGTAMDRTYSIKGTATHDHQLTLTAADFEKLKQNTSGVVMETSSDDGTHSHVVTVFCA
jgi:hypothetical protein